MLETWRVPVARAVGASIAHNGRDTAKKIKVFWHTAKRCAKPVVSQGKARAARSCLRTTWPWSIRTGTTWALCARQIARVWKCLASPRRPYPSRASVGGGCFGRLCRFCVDGGCPEHSTRHGKILNFGYNQLYQIRHIFEPGVQSVIETLGRTHLLTFSSWITFKRKHGYHPKFAKH